MGLQLESASELPATVLAGQLLAGVHQHVLQQHELLGHPAATDLAFMWQNRLLSRVSGGVLLQGVILQCVPRMELFLAGLTEVTLPAAALLGGHLVLRGVFGASMVLEIGGLVEAGTALFADEFPRQIPGSAKDGIKITSTIESKLQYPHLGLCLRRLCFCMATRLV